MAYTFYTIHSSVKMIPFIFIFHFSFRLFLFSFGWIYELLTHRTDLPFISLSPSMSIRFCMHIHILSLICEANVHNVFMYFKCAHFPHHKPCTLHIAYYTTPHTHTKCLNKWREKRVTNRKRYIANGMSQRENYNRSKLIYIKRLTEDLFIFHECFQVVYKRYRNRYREYYFCYKSIYMWTSIFSQSNWIDRMKWS